MKNTKKIILMILLTFICGVSVRGAYLENVPITITQPDGTTIDCFATGDEYYNWVHDKDGYTIVQNHVTGYYYYAKLDNDSLICSSYMVGKISPKSVNLTPNINISGEKILKIVKNSPLYQDNLRSVAKRRASDSRTRSNTGTINNIVIFIRFADQIEFPADNHITYSKRFNGLSDYPYSVRSYFREVSYNKLDILSHFFPSYNGVDIISYKDIHIRDYYRPYDTITNRSGYKSLYEQVVREKSLLYNVINLVKSKITRTLSASELDYNNDGFVDNICFVVKDSVSPFDFEQGLGFILWPHKSVLSPYYNISINGKTVHDYNLVTWISTIGVLQHEINHTLGAPDLYHYNHDGMDPVGRWDLMSIPANYGPPHMTAYMKYQYGGWIDSIPVITKSGTYTLQPLTSASNNCYKIFIQGISQYTRQYIVLEYRKKSGNGGFEDYHLPGSGLIIYRIQEDLMPWGNRNGYDSGGVADEVYVFRPGGKIYPADSKGNIDNAHFSETVGRTEFGNDTDPYCFRVQSGAYGNIYINNIRENTDGTLSFDFHKYCDDDDIIFSNTSNLPAEINASNSIQTTGPIIVKSTDNVIFEAGNEVILGPGFEVELGGTFEINMTDCVE